jgi:hypothetical protein
LIVLTRFFFPRFVPLVRSWFQNYRVGLRTKWSDYQEILENLLVLIAISTCKFVYNPMTLQRTRSSVNHNNSKKEQQQTNSLTQNNNSRNPQQLEIVFDPNKSSIPTSLRSKQVFDQNKSSIKTSLRSKQVIDPNESSIPSLRSQQPSLLSQQAFDPKSSIPSLRPQVFNPKSLIPSLWSQRVSKSLIPTNLVFDLQSLIPTSLWSQQVFDPNESLIPSSLRSQQVFNPNKSSTPTSLRI